MDVIVSVPEFSYLLWMQLNRPGEQMMYIRLMYKQARNTSHNNSISPTDI